jgi:hypothetical protein
MYQNQQKEHSNNYKKKAAKSRINTNQAIKKSKNNFFTILSH